MSLAYSESTSIVDESRFSKEAAPAKAYADGLLYATVNRFLHGTPLIISGPDYFKHVRRGFLISRKPKVRHECVILIDIDKEVGRILRKKREIHRRIDPEKAAKAKLLTGPKEGNVITAESQRLEDLDLMETWHGRANSETLTAEEIFCLRLRKQRATYPGSKHYKAIMFTAVLRNSKGGKITIVEGLNKLLDIIGAEIAGFEFTPRYNDVWDTTNQLHEKLSVFEQMPIYKRRGRLVKMRIIRYQEYKKTPMLTGVILWK